MAKIARDEEREKRLHFEIVVDAHDVEEQAMGWYCYLDECLQTPFRARCIAVRTISPLCVGEEVNVTGMAPEDECRARNVCDDRVERPYRWASHWRN